MIPQITTDELQTRMEQERVALIDVREVHEYRAGHVPGAVSMPLGLLPVRVHELPSDATLHVICQSGGRSMQACTWLARNGRGAVNVLGGTGAWASSGKPVDVAASG